MKLLNDQSLIVKFFSLFYTPMHPFSLFSHVVLFFNVFMFLSATMFHIFMGHYLHAGRRKHKEATVRGWKTNCGLKTTKIGAVAYVKEAVNTLDNLALKSAPMTPAQKKGP